MTNETEANQKSRSLDFSWPFTSSRVIRRYISLVIAFPPIVGFAILIAVLCGFAADDVLDSGLATSTALLVGAVLILGPPALFVASPKNYADYQTGVRKRVAEPTRGANSS